jgi:hypothetical protein
MAWHSKNRKIREIGVEALQFVDGIRSASRWGIAVEAYDENDTEHDVPRNESFSEDGHGSETIMNHVTPLTRKPSGRSKGRPSMGEGDEEV